MLLFVTSGYAQGKQPEKDKLQHSRSLNRLNKARSPYLQQHADNPVDWYEWGDEALEKARKENKPLIISIGYAACHWCHVMEHESFMDSTVAKLMNDNFVAIKIDREERPDIDQIYMNAAQLLTGSGGWPLNAFALPDGRPFYAGTYFPKAQWKDLLRQISDIYKNQHEKAVAQAKAVTQGIRSQEVITVAGKADPGFTTEAYDKLFDGWDSRIDHKRGGYARAPKFPLPVGWEFLLQYHYLTGNKEALKAVTTTLDAMSRGGIYDQVGGGFARYSTDARWFAPHFEKMLYDNGQLVSLYAHAYQVTNEEKYAGVIRETLDFIAREMTHTSGGFYSSLNADSEGEEGKFYVWTKKELENALDSKTAKLLIDYFQVTVSGNWEGGKNILYRKSDAGTFAQKHNIAREQWEETLAQARKTLLKERSKRIRPTTDDKILTGWNALMLKGYVNAYLALGEKSYLEAAVKNAGFLEKNMMGEDGHLWRNYKDGEAGIDGFLDDYALLADAYIQLYQATFNVHWLRLAKKITGYAITHFRDENSGMFYYTSDQSENLVARKMEITDNVIPASNSVMAGVLYRLGEYFYDKDHIRMSRTMLAHTEEYMAKGGPYYANWAMLMGLIAYQPYEIAVMGGDAGTKSHDLQKKYLPTALFMGGTAENLPLLENKLVDGETMIYVCRDKVCQLPVQEVRDALDQLEKDW
ncbi:thioredoxin domain-containing protein [Sinomicrobium sp. FJxs]|uniref:Thioredoxin domain-containing protein n=2 Tax=Sinomicrobium weinanense TaxID=2842200 RepID=A0A926Q0K0_9FLAO|nr:thioredoxin domain-containing protein [Sinomicrobium weinanense]MBU3125147.1 thioredoxin domain-containing protein [Sinomicrobium weinanense]